MESRSGINQELLSSSFSFLFFCFIDYRLKPPPLEQGWLTFIPMSQVWSIDLADNVEHR